jgi:hypothetical protein
MGRQATCTATGISAAAESARSSVEDNHNV